MNTLSDLYNFIDIAKNNRKYPQSIANNLKSALKIFEKELNDHEINSIELMELNIEEIFINLVAHNKDKSIGSLNTYKARYLKLIKDYKRYGTDPSKIQNWTVKPRKSTPLLNKKDKQDNNQDKPQQALSNFTNTPVENVHKIELALKNGAKATIILPQSITQSDAEIMKGIVDIISRNG